MFVALIFRPWFWDLLEAKPMSRGFQRPNFYLRKPEAIKFLFVFHYSIVAVRKVLR